MNHTAGQNPRVNHSEGWYKARPEQVILFGVSAWDTNCPQHIPQRFEAADVAAALVERDARIQALEAEIKRLSAPPGGISS
jgi:hypothetical protein